MNKRICTTAAVLALTMCTVHAEAVYNLDEVIVEADMDKARDAFGDIVTEQSYARTGGDVEVITRKEIEEKHFQNITDAVRRVPGVYINDMGYHGGEYDGGPYSQQVTINGMDMSWCCWMGGGWIIRRLIRPADSPAPAGMDRLCLCI